MKNCKFLQNCSALRIFQLYQELYLPRKLQCTSRISTVPRIVNTYKTAVYFTDFNHTKNCKFLQNCSVLHIFQLYQELQILRKLQCTSEISTTPRIVNLYKTAVYFRDFNCTKNIISLQNCNVLRIFQLYQELEIPTKLQCTSHILTVPRIVITYKTAVYFTCFNCT